eukprot:COSAG02_NODE_2328_length_9122_cov_7.787100_4_plen_54_part_00
MHGYVPSLRHPQECSALADLESGCQRLASPAPKTGEPMSESTVHLSAEQVVIK